MSSWAATAMRPAARRPAIATATAGRARSASALGWSRCGRPGCPTCRQEPRPSSPRSCRGAATSASRPSACSRGSTFYDFPAEHWLHIRTSNAIESVFAGVRLRTDVAKRAWVRENALYLVWKIVTRLGQHWRVLNGGATLMALLLGGETFRDGALVRRPPEELELELEEVRAA
jgi:hypothetical protein